MSDLLVAAWVFVIGQIVVNLGLLARIAALWRYVWLIERVRELKEQLEAKKPTRGD